MLVRVAWLFCLAWLCGIPLAAQRAGSIGVAAVVQEPIAGTVLHALAFSVVAPGAAVTVATASPSAGAFAVFGVTGHSVGLVFALPTELSLGVDSLSVGAWTGRWRADDPRAGTTFTPSDAATPAVIGAEGSLVVLLGATVSPGASQPPGTYTGVAALTILY
ncbi:MAG TPA: DUF4402 domain-containing protein [Gemmatimonadales bacterium]|nr:DUF4402 domain-containing protein [Gemmatimonadales bacterium]